jgi:hypothetical protein
LSVSVADHEKIEITCWDDDMGSDDLIGKGTISLADVFKGGYLDRWVQLADKKKKPAGEVHVAFHARNPAGIPDELKEEYPILRPNVESFVIPDVKSKDTDGSGVGSPRSPGVGSPRTPSQKGFHGGALMPVKSWKENKGTLRVKVSAGLGGRARRTTRRAVCPPSLTSFHRRRGSPIAGSRAR